jgi:hypothetical protein
MKVNVTKLTGARPAGVGEAFLLISQGFLSDVLSAFFHVLLCCCFSVGFAVLAVVSLYLFAFL